MDKAILHPHGAGKALPAAPTETQREYLRMWPRWSLGVRTANLIFLSGMGGVDGSAVPQHVDDPVAQVHVAMHRIVTALELAGGRAADLIKIRVFLDDPANAAAVLTGLDEFLADNMPGSYPALCMVVANTSSREIHTEIEVIAATGHRSVTSPRLSAGYGSVAVLREHAHAVQVGSLWFSSGIAPTDPVGKVVGDTVTEQVDQVTANITALFEDCGLTNKDLVKLTVWIDDAADVQDVCVRLGAWISNRSGAVPPVVTVMVAPLAWPGVRLQVEAIASTSPHRAVAAPVRHGTTDLIPASHGIVVALESDEGSYLRRFTWPDHPSDLNPELYAGLSPHHGPMGHLLLLSAQAGVGPDGALADGMSAQTFAAFENMRAVTEAAGAEFADLVQFDIYYRDRSLYPEYNRVRIDYLDEHNPDKEWFAGSGPKAVSPRDGGLIEIESIAIVPGERTRLRNVTPS